MTGSNTTSSALHTGLPALQPALLPHHSRFFQRLHRRYGAELPLLPPGLVGHAQLAQAYAALRERGLTVGDGLRVLRQLVMERLIALDCGATAPPELSTVTLTVTHLAEFALDIAVQDAFATLDALHGAPIASSATLAAAALVGATARPDQRAELWVVGMGKLGARELNVSSDIDLIYVYDFDGETAGSPEGRGRISNHEYFAKAVKRVYALVGETTDHGFVFRVDLALRPNGNSGPSAVSLGALEAYLQVQGREWERFAWLKSRVVAPRACVVSNTAQALRPVVLPFVFRRYLDYGVFDALRNLHQQIRDHSARRSAGRPERANDVKLSRGGIREIEFTVQLLQVVRGGQFPELRTRPTLAGLQRLAKAELMSQETANALAAAYVFLRRVEHRIQYLDDQQTHLLPVREDDVDWIAHTLAYLDRQAFLADLQTHRDRVALEFDQLLGEHADAAGPTADETSDDDKPSPVLMLHGLDIAAMASTLPPALGERLLLWREHPRILALREDARLRLARLLERTAQWVHAGDNISQQVSPEAAVRLLDWLEPLLRRESYLALLLERPRVHARLLRLLGAARWPARYLVQHPGVIDELANNAMLSERFAPAAFEQELEERRAALAITGEDDDEALLNLLRRAHHAEVFRTLARDVEEAISIEQVADDLSALADVVLRVTSRWCWNRLKNKHRDQPQFGIIGYGKLGGRELGYGSDLDIVFVYDDQDEEDRDRAFEVYAIFVRKLVNWLGVKTREGDLFEIDTALRPNGNSGLLITTFNAYANYQQQRGSNTAWTWEHQAMTRTRFVLGDEALRQRFDAVRLAVITSPREAQALRLEIITMRDKVRAAHPVKSTVMGGAFDVKHGLGGMVDAEFAVQYLVLSQSAAHPVLTHNLGNIGLLVAAETAGLLPPGIGQAAASAYRTLRHIQHRARLDEQATVSSSPAATLASAAIQRLWERVFSTKPIAK
jgi:[glutamine synthetase] adenylyltransferase / [glutamine synthetase]-adenylyl-L-tyrosine phosphorylase